MKNTNAPKTPDARLVVSSKQLHVSSAAGAFSAVEKGAAMEDHKSNTEKCWQANLDYPVNITPPAEAKTAPVASGDDWFELAGLTLVTEGYITETRYRRALEAVRLGVDRG